MEDIIKMNLRKIRCGLDSTHSGYGLVAGFVDKVMNIQAP
jgi:hypothetical protein